MAGDGLCTAGSLVHGTAVRKVMRLEDGRLVGCAGTAYGLNLFSEWLIEGGEKPRLPESFEALVLNRDGSCLSYNEHCQSCEQEVPAVTGSGGALALGAMLSGLSPEESIKIAAQRDAYTGGAIIALHLIGP